MEIKIKKQFKFINGLKTLYYRLFGGDLPHERALIGHKGIYSQRRYFLYDGLIWLRAGAQSRPVDTFRGYA